MWSKSYGEGNPLVMIHGMGSASTAWKLITPELSKKFKVIHIDLPGHGNTPLRPWSKMDPKSLASSIVEELHEIGIERFHLVGNSLGGWISLEISSAFPEKVITLTAIAPAGLWLTPYDKRYPANAFSRWFATSTYALAPTALHFEWARKIGFESVSPKWKKLSYQTCLDATIAMGTSDGYFPAWDGLLTHRFDKEIPANIPITIIFGDSDKTLPADTCQEKSLAPLHARWVVVSESGHAPMWDHPDFVIQEILATTGMNQSGE